MIKKGCKMGKMSKMKPAAKVVSLRPATEKWIAEVQGRFVLDSHHKMLLLLAARAFDRAYDASVDIDKNGQVFSDRLGNLRANPAIKAELDYSNLYARLLRELALDVEPPEAPRPNPIRRSF